jgi:hypothetical protein
MQVKLSVVWAVVTLLLPINSSNPNLHHTLWSHTTHVTSFQLALSFVFLTVLLQKVHVKRNNNSYFFNLKCLDEIVGQVNISNTDMAFDILSVAMFINLRFIASVPYHFSISVSCTCEIPVYCSIQCADGSFGSWKLCPKWAAMWVWGNIQTISLLVYFWCFCFAYGL